ncbi:MAG: CBS domain-containing protein [Pyrinomonadaceae bacterium]
MSRYDRDDDFGRARAYGDRGRAPRDYGRGAGSYSEYDEGLARGRGRDFERERDYYGGREYRNDYATGAVGRRGERLDYDEREYGRGRARYEDEDRSFWAEARERLRGRDERRGASRSHVRCRDIMTRDVTVATRVTTLGEVAKLMRDEDTGVIPVVELDDASLLEGNGKAQDAPRVNNRMRSNGKLVGLITDRDIVVRAVAEGKDVTVTRAEEIMTTDIHTAQPNDRVIDAVRKMGDKQVRRIPVVDRDGLLRGIISMADVALETNDDRELAEALEEISSGSSFWNRVFG